MPIIHLWPVSKLVRSRHCSGGFGMSDPNKRLPIIHRWPVSKLVSRSRLDNCLAAQCLQYATSGRQILRVCLVVLEPAWFSPSKECHNIPSWTSFYNCDITPTISCPDFGIESPRRHGATGYPLRPPDLLSCGSPSGFDHKPAPTAPIA